MDKIRKYTKAISELRPKGFWPGFIFGLAYFSYIFSWIWSVYPLDSLGVTNKFLGFILVLFVFMITVACASFFWGLFSFFSKRMSGDRRVWVLPFYLASLFVMAEYLRSWGMGLIWLGSGSFLGPHWTFGNPAYLLSFLPSVIKTSSLWGIYGIDFLIIFLLAALVLGVGKGSGNRRILLGEVVLALILSLIAGNIPAGKQGGTPLTVSVIQTKNPARVDYSSEEILGSFGQENLLLKSAAKNSDIVMFPETTNFSQTLSGFFNPAQIQKYFSNLNSKSILVVDSDRIAEPDGMKSKVIFIDSKNGIAGAYNKKLLTPMGEFIPYILKIPFSIFGFLNKNYSGFSEFAPGYVSNVLPYQDKNIELLVCSDIVSPSIGRGGAFGLILGLNSLGLFNGNWLIANELAAAARFRAAENGKYLVMASNYGLSYIVDPQGNIAGSTASSDYQILTGTVVLNAERTWYNKLGDWPILLLSVIFLSIGQILTKWIRKQP